MKRTHNLTLTTEQLYFLLNTIVPQARCALVSASCDHDDKAKQTKDPERLKDLEAKAAYYWEQYKQAVAFHDLVINKVEKLQGKKG